MDTKTLNTINEITSVGEWKEVKDYPNYVVNTDGDVLSKKTGKLLKHQINTRGYKFVRLRNDGKPKMLLVHRLVAITFIPNPDNKPVVNHIDSNRENPQKTNLEWVTHKENSEHMVNHFRCPNQTMTILLDKKGDEIGVFPSYKRCINYACNHYRFRHGYKEGEDISHVDMELYTDLPAVLRDGRVAKRIKLTF
ncbi:NUMOD4 domain-containing protein [Guptibacillus spartinae]|uniref:NUMOD4 domain-containing protein n=1 Tax=Guptibacillus spartinae TaxID=3025679 RepID=UPI00236006F9|nr:NUMOD4 domain-containing protein [Pseudalkalibacillus spartinae]